MEHNQQATYTHDNMDASQMHFPAWEKPDFKGYRTYDNISMIS